MAPYDLFKLNHVYKTDRREFIITSREADTILLNSETENITEIKEIVAQIMEYRMMQGGISKLFDRIEELAGGRTEKTLLWIWHEWWDARIKKDKTRRKVFPHRMYFNPSIYAGSRVKDSVGWSLTKHPILYIIKYNPCIQNANEVQYEF